MKMLQVMDKAINMKLIMGGTEGYKNDECELSYVQDIVTRCSVRKYHFLSIQLFGEVLGMKRKDAGIILVTAVSIALIYFLFFGMYDVMESYSKRSASGTEEDVTDEKELCIVSGCILEHMRGSLYCRKHICLKSGCTEKAIFDTHYCKEHMSMSINSEPSMYSYRSEPKSTTNNRSSSPSSSYQPYIAYDPYDVYDYADGDDFADEWAEEFGDGDYDEGYDEAYDYWEDEME